MIKLAYLEATEEMITNIRIIDVSEDFLELDFGGEIRRFVKE